LAYSKAFNSFGALSTLLGITLKTHGGKFAHKKKYYTYTRFKASPLTLYPNILLTCPYISIQLGFCNPYIAHTFPYILTFVKREAPIISPSPPLGGPTGARGRGVDASHDLGRMRALPRPRLTSIKREFAGL
jgi:hypothetical protein